MHVCMYVSMCIYIYIYIYIYHIKLYYTHLVNANISDFKLLSLVINISF